MNPVFRYTLLAAAAATLAFGLTYALLRPSAATARDADEIAWLQKEFHLTPPQVATIGQLHADYFPVCMKHCRLVIAAREKLATAADPTAARAELVRLEAICREATQAHLQRVAQAMNPDEAARFLALVGPKVSGQNHDAPLGLK